MGPRIRISDEDRKDIISQFRTESHFSIRSASRRLDDFPITIDVDITNRGYRLMVSNDAGVLPVFVVDRSAEPDIGIQGVANEFLRYADWLISGIVG
jgi:hypothetical protein